MGAMPGKQFVTFLLVANIAMFFFHTFEGMKQGAINNGRATPVHTIVVFAVAPLIIFYRFHCSVCLAEIWKHCYDMKHGSGHGSDTTSHISTRHEQPLSRQNSAPVLDSM